MRPPQKGRFFRVQVNPTEASPLMSPKVSVAAPATTHSDPLSPKLLHSRHGLGFRGLGFRTISVRISELGSSLNSGPV